MTLNSDTYARLAPMVKEAAGKFRQLGVEHDDLEQELWVSCLQSADYVTRMLSDEDSEKGEGRVRGLLTNAGKAYSVRDKAQRDGYKLQDLYWYSSVVIRDVLPSVFNYTDWLPGTATNGEGRSHNPANEGNDRQAFLVDIKWAVEQLDLASQAVLEAHYGANLTHEEVAVAFDSTGEAIRKRIDRLVVKILALLGGPRPQFDGPGSRRAMSNSTAQAVTGEEVA